MKLDKSWFEAVAPSDEEGQAAYNRHEAKERLNDQGRMF